MTERDPFTHLTGAFDRPVAPAPDFATRLRAQVVAELADFGAVDTTTVRVHSVSGGAAPKEGSTMSVHVNGNGQVIDLRTAVPTVVPHRVHPHRRAHRLLRWMPALEVAAAFLLMMILFGQLIGPETLRNAVIPPNFQPAQTNTPRNAAMWGANPGRTWEFDGVIPASAPGEAAVFPATEEVDNATDGIMSGDTLVRLVSERGSAVPAQHLEAVSIRTGQRQWIVPMTVETVPAIAAGRVFIAAAEFGQAATETFVIALDLANGGERWRTPISGPRTTDWATQPFVVDSTVFVANDLGTVHALDVETGALQWQTPRDVEQAAVPGGALLDTAGITAADTERLYVTTAAAEIVALDLDTGEVVWRLPFAPQYGESFLGAKLMTDGGVVILDLLSGRQPSQSSGGTGLANSIIVGLDAQDGHQRWIRRGVPPSGVHALSNGLVVAAIMDDRTNDGSAWIFALRATDGTEVWRLTDIPVQTVHWSVAGDQLLAVNPRGSLVALRLSNGHIIWEVPLPQIFPTGPPLVTQNEIVVVGHNGEVAVWRI